eukprot:292510-Pleurochrysis_carterae.AAC.1
MIELGDLWKYSLSALESYHAQVGRVSDRTGCTRIEIEQGQTTSTTVPVGRSGKYVGKQGPAQRVEVQAKATMAST